MRGPISVPHAPTLHAGSEDLEANWLLHEEHETTQRPRGAFGFYVHVCMNLNWIDWKRSHYFPYIPACSWNLAAHTFCIALEDSLFSPHFWGNRMFTCLPRRRSTGLLQYGSDGHRAIKSILASVIKMLVKYLWASLNCWICECFTNENESEPHLKYNWGLWCL